MGDDAKSKGRTERALYNKYDVYKDGELQIGCFVLKPTTDPAARAALLTYAHETDNEQLAEEIKEWLKVLDGLEDVRERFVETDGQEGDRDV